ncbi:MAG: hypothetical protein WKF37_08865 [Bryobacteraceae bacterium]
MNISDYTTGMPQINIDGFSAPLVGYTNSLPWIRAETGYFYVEASPRWRAIIR